LVFPRPFRAQGSGDFQDITARKQAEAAKDLRSEEGLRRSSRSWPPFGEALSEARSELAKVARTTSIETLTASIAHEVNQPLSGIITNASTCLRMLTADPPKVDGARETARRTFRDGNLGL
jgi:C4-dicarboxylate-specific signal transduction histidine kinase